LVAICSRDRPPNTSDASANRSSVSSVTRKKRPSMKSGDNTAFHSTARPKAAPSSQRLLVASVAADTGLESASAIARHQYASR
jgi:hypothetical protein